MPYLLSSKVSAACRQSLNRPEQRNHDNTPIVADADAGGGGQLSSQRMSDGAQKRAWKRKWANQLQPSPVETSSVRACGWD